MSHHDHDAWVEEVAAYLKGWQRAIDAEAERARFYDNQLDAHP